MKTEQTIFELRDDLERYADAIRSARAALKGTDTLSPHIGGIAHELRRVASALMTGAVELQQAQRLAAAEARTELIL